jgi:signal transduction histidine kinase
MDEQAPLPSAPHLDRTEQLTARIAELEAALAAAERRYDAWLSIVSHDLRGPLTLVLGYAENLLHRAQSARASHRTIHDLESIVGAARRLNKMVTQVVEGARLDGRRLALNARVVDVAPAVREAARAAYKLYSGHVFRLDLPESLPGVRCDPRACESILGALLSNAAIFSPPESPIVLSATVTADSIQIVVTDRGIGLTADELEHLFERRYRSERMRDFRREGLGMSLWIARGLARLSGGNLEITSAGADQGVVARLELPRDAGNVREEEEAAATG